jgi:hypothetical protein
VLTTFTQHASGCQVFSGAARGYNKEVDVFSLGIVLLDLIKQLNQRLVKLVIPVRGVS